MTKKKDLPFLELPECSTLLRPESSQGEEQDSMETQSTLIRPETFRTQPARERTRHANGIRQANEQLELCDPSRYNIELEDSNESECIEMDLGLGVFDVQDHGEKDFIDSSEEDNSPSFGDHFKDEDEEDGEKKSLARLVLSQRRAIKRPLAEILTEDESSVEFSGDSPRQTFPEESTHTSSSSSP